MNNVLNISPLLHAEGEHGAHSFITEFLTHTFGEAGAFIDQVVLHAVIDTLKLLLFLFLTYLLMEFIEHKASDKARGLMRRAGVFGPAIGGAFGILPQCGFSAAASNLYTGRVITLGTLIAVFLSTSDEMLPILLAGEIDIITVVLIVVYKTLVGILVGFGIDLVLRLLGRKREKIDIDEICDNDDCHCESGILRSAVHHTLTVSLFIFVATMLINAVIFFVGEDNLSSIIVDIPVLSHLICSIIGLIPNCAASVVLTQLAISGFISVGAMISGLLTGAGVGLLVLYRMNKRIKENIVITLLLVAFGVVFGIIADFIPVLAL